MNKQEGNPRLVLIDTVVYTMRDTKPISLDFRRAVPLASEEQPYLRRFKVGETWSKLSFGWLDEQRVALLVISNEGQGTFKVNPTKEEKEQAEAKVVVVAVGGIERENNILRIHPGDMVKFHPEPGQSYWICCGSGETTCHISAFPE